MSERETLMIRLRRFFQDNPGEELTPKDIAVKFGVSHWTASTTITAMQRKGEIERVKVVRAVVKVAA